MPHEIASVLTCKLCNEKIAGPGLIVGPGQASGRVAQFMEKLTAHLGARHPKELGALHQKALEFFGLNCVMQYVTQDDRVKYQREFLRWSIHQVTLDARYSNEQLDDAAASHAEACTLAVVNGLAPALGIPEERLTRAMENVRPQIAALFLEPIKIMREKLQEPEPPPMPAGVSVVKVG